MTLLRCQNPTCKRVVGEAEGRDFRIRVKCRRCKRENTFTSSAKMLNQQPGETLDPLAEAFRN